ncbi:tripartite motif-containing protein 44 isoform X2 [Dunckerocampus dactyliophorus]|uniref:tripartite motif-containing protein 44 isoform X2 n=1 Tax=Dunckerocampus dactyliophorus TaxID=161453 RepID=UPI002404EEAD|nr:tripartite motif-containing protein 44 isoform X2 [Dunckerocampus dactyliophorus]
MDHKGKPWEGAMSLEELPQMDGTCDACEPDEAQLATQVCNTCSFAFCSVHAEIHASSRHHPLTPYNHEGTQATGLGPNRDSGIVSGDKAEILMELPDVQDLSQAELVDESGDAENSHGSKNGLLLETEFRAEGSKEGQETVVAGEAVKKDTVTVERLRCMEHGQEGSLYCKADEKIICVVCAVQGEHQDHEIITLHEAYIWQKNRQGYDLLGCTRQMGEKITSKWTNPKMSADQMEVYVNTQFDELRRLVHLEEKRTLHLVDLKEAVLTASAAEKIAEITVQTKRLQEEMASITQQLCMLEQAQVPTVGPALATEDFAEAPGPVHRIMVARAEGSPGGPTGL